jgi:GTP-binding protein
MLNVLIENDPFLGRLLTGRIESGKAVPGLAIKALDRDGKEIERGRITKVLAFRGLKRSRSTRAEAGDIVAIAGMSKATVADTLCAHGGHGGPAGPADRSADHLDDRLGQRQPAGRPRRRQGPVARHP